MEGGDVQVWRNDRIAVEEIQRQCPAAIIISPGPGDPSQAGVSVEAVIRLGAKIPILGVCLGHQAIAAAYGGRVVRAQSIMHGKTSRIFHDGRSLFRGLPNPFEAVRYHSLVAEKASLPECLEISAWSEDGEIMGIRHRRHRVEGVQFHPESILTTEGRLIIENFIVQNTHKRSAFIGTNGEGNMAQGEERAEGCSHAPCTLVQIN
jgi:anthranilate synthase/aminodeoxychorismate synthase-like glutamine amidotransferase